MFSIGVINDLSSPLKGSAYTRVCTGKWLFSFQFWSLLKWALFFEAVAKIGSNLESSRLVQFSLFKSLIHTVHHSLHSLGGGRGVQFLKRCFFVVIWKIFFLFPIVQLDATHNSNTFEILKTTFWANSIGCEITSMVLIMPLKYLQNRSFVE